MDGVNIPRKMCGVTIVALYIQCSPCKSNPDTTNFLLIRRFLESRHIYNTKNSNGMSCIIRSRIGLVYVYTYTGVSKLFNHVCEVALLA